jgi:Putative Ig domain
MAVRAALFAFLVAAAPTPGHAGPPSSRDGSPPTISGTPPTSVAAGNGYLFRPAAADPDGNRLQFRISNLPVWASFDKSTGTLRGTPGPSMVGTYANLQIRVTDGKNWVGLPAFDIMVVASTSSTPTTSAPGNSAPLISGSPPTSARAGQPYAFRPTSSDADGDSLTFKIQGMPAWATFDTTDGTLAGTPAAADVGTISNVVISVTDGSATTNLSAFSIEVAEPLTTSAKVSWRPPTTNVDGTPITGLAGFRVLYGNVSGQYGQSLLVSSPSVTSVVIEGLSASTTWYFVVKAIATSGVESDFSTEASKTM